MWSRHSRRIDPMSLSTNGFCHGERGRRQNLLDLEPRDTPVEVASVDLISVPQQVTRCLIPGKGVNRLLRCPLGRRMFRDIEMNDTATIVTEEDEDEQNPEGCSRQSKEVDGHQVLHMIIEKAPPGLGRWLPVANHVLGHRGWEMDIPSFTSSPCTRGAPQRGLASLIFRDRISARTSGATAGRPGRRLRLFHVQ